MAWTAKITAKSKAGGKGFVTVDFSSGTEVKTETFTIDFQNATLEWLKRMVQTRIDQLNSAYDFIDGLTFNPNVVFDTTPAPYTQYQINLEAFKADCLYLRRADKGVRAGVFTGTEQVIVDTKARIKTNMTANLNDLAYQGALELLP